MSDKQSLAASMYLDVQKVICSSRTFLTLSDRFTNLLKVLSSN